MSIKRIWHHFHLFRNLIKITRNPNETQAGLAVADHLYKLGYLDRELQKAMAEPECLEVIKHRTMVTGLDIQKLAQCPDGTLGKIYSDYMIANQLDPNFYKVLEVKNDSLFFMMRMRQTHDLWHLITGFELNVPGELGLQAFMMAQTNTTLSPLLIGGYLIVTSLKNPNEAVRTLEQVTRGWRMGRAARPIFGLDWSANWNTPIEALRKAYGIELNLFINEMNENKLKRGEVLCASL